MKELIVSGNINDRSYQIDMEIFEKILKAKDTENISNMIALYSFYCYSNKFQKTKKIKSIAKELGWEESKIVITNKSLIKIGLINKIGTEIYEILSTRLF